MTKKILKYTAIILGLSGLLAYLLFIFPFWGIPFNAQRHGPPPLTPAWALECWLWEDDVNAAAYVDELLAGYAQHDIPVRTILIDSPWSLRYNDYSVDEERYPAAEQWFKRLQDQDYRVVLWMTSMVCSHSKDTRIPDGGEWFAEAAEKGWLTGNNNEIKWWKGRGGFIDYTNPEALRWWQQQQQACFDWGIDGWKLDGTATLFHQMIGPLPFLYQQSASGWISTRQYMDLYYRTEYQHGLSQNPEFVTLSRSLDRGYHPEGFAPIDAAPVTWVGDQEHAWLTEELLNSNDEEQVDMALEGVQGFEAAIQSILKSADKGYNVIGSDVAGFSGKTIPPRLYIRWAQFSTFCGLFLNGGHGERALWKRSPQELEIIRKFSWLHTELVPYMYSYVVQGHQGGRVLQEPVAGKYHYLFGDHLLIAPIYKDELEHTVQLPAGKWRYWFDDQDLITGDQVLDRAFPLEEFPVFIREGAIIPMDIQRAYTGLGDSLSQNYLTWLIYPDETSPSSFTVYSSDQQEATKLEVTLKDAQLSLSFTGRALPHILRIHLATAPRAISLNGEAVKGFTYDAEKQKLIIKGEANGEQQYLISW